MLKWLIAVYIVRHGQTHLIQWLISDEESQYVKTANNIIATNKKSPLILSLTKHNNTSDVPTVDEREIKREKKTRLRFWHLISGMLYKLYTYHRHHFQIKGWKYHLKNQVNVNTKGVLSFWYVQNLNFMHHSNILYSQTWLGNNSYMPINWLLITTQQTVIWKLHQLN